MRPEDFDFLYRLEEHYWWFAGMRRIADAIIAPQFRNRRLDILDAGCGTGYNLRHYQNAGHTVYGLDVAAEAVDGVRRRGFSRVVQASVTDIPYAGAAFDAVFSFDVICQIPADAALRAVHEMHRVLKPGGVLFIRVPAFEWLRSSHDADLHTLHRYSLPELETALRQAGFKLHVSTYANSLLFPIVVVRRTLKRYGIGAGTDVKPLPAGLGWIDPLFRGALSTEAALLRLGLRLPAGLSAICYAAKPI